jgi:hypothetical protein
VSTFDDLLAGAHAVFDDLMGDDFRVHPRAKADPNKRGSADGSRPGTPTVRGVYIERGARAGDGAGQLHIKPADGAHSTAFIIVSILLSSLPWELRQGDRLERVSDGLLLNVAEIRPEGDGRSAVDLNLLKGPP